MPVRRALAAVLALPVLASVYLSAGFRRRGLAPLLALPVLATIYLPLTLHRRPATRIALALGIGAVILVAAVGVPAGTVGAPEAQQTPLEASELGPAVATSRDLASAVLVDFDAPMDAASVAAALTVDPPADVSLDWSADGRRLAVTPATAWTPATYYTVTVGAGARDRSGRELATPLRAGFLTRELTAARLGLTDRATSKAALDTSVVLAFDRPVSVAAVARAFRIVPEVPGRILVATDGADVGDATMADSFVWQPLDSLAGETRYTARLASGVLDEDGSPVAQAEALSFTTTAAPSVVRFRPRAGTGGVARDVPVSVRFTMPMNRKATAAAFRVEVNGTPVAGTVDWAEDDTVLVFDPKAAFPYSAKVVLRVTSDALAADGTPLDRGRAGRFTVVAKPKPASKPATTAQSSTRPAPAPAPPKATRPPSSSSLAAEKYLLTLMNRERARVGVRALAYHAGISNSVARPYAKRLVAANVCSHFYGGTVQDRLRAAGYTGPQWGENLGCRYFADPRDAAESLVRFFLGSPAHYANMVASKYSHAGIGLWSSGGRLRFVVVFYTP